MEPVGESPYNVDILQYFREAEADYRNAVGSLDRACRWGDLSPEAGRRLVITACRKLAKRLHESIIESSLRRGVAPRGEELTDKIANRVADIAEEELINFGIEDSDLRAELWAYIPTPSGQSDALLELVMLASGLPVGSTVPTSESVSVGFGVEPSEVKADEIKDRAQHRKAVVQPLLKAKHFLAGTWATRAGVPTSTVYDYLNGKTKRLNYDSRNCMAEALGIEEEKLPE